MILILAYIISPLDNQEKKYSFTLSIVFWIHDMS